MQFNPLHGICPLQEYIVGDAKQKVFLFKKKINPFDNALGNLGKLDKGRQSTSDVYKEMPVFSVLYGPT